MTGGTKFGLLTLVIVAIGSLTMAAWPAAAGSEGADATDPSSAASEETSTTSPATAPTSTAPTSTTAPTTTSAPTTTVPATTTTVDPINSALVESILQTRQHADFEIFFRQEVGDLTAWESITIVDGARSTDSGFNGVNSSVLIVDGRKYELEGDTWYLKPVTLREFAAGTDTTADFANLENIEATSVIEWNETNEYLVDCASLDGAPRGGIIVDRCADGLDVTIHTNRETGIVASIIIDGDFETWPGRFSNGFVEIELEPLDDADPIEAPDPVDTSRYDCIAREVGATHYLEVADAIDSNLTDENQELFGSCGFRIFPRGADLT